MNTQAENTHSFWAKLDAVMHLSDSDFELIQTEAKRHYDAKVRSTAAIGGFLYGINNRRNHTDSEDKVVQISSDNIQLMINFCARLKNFTQLSFWKYFIKI